MPYRTAQFRDEPVQVFDTAAAFHAAIEAAPSVVEAEPYLRALGDDAEAWVLLFDRFGDSARLGSRIKAAGAVMVRAYGASDPGRYAHVADTVGIDVYALEAPPYVTHGLKLVEALGVARTASHEAAAEALVHEERDAVREALLRRKQETTPPAPEPKRPKGNTYLAPDKGTGTHTVVFPPDASGNLIRRPNTPDGVVVYDMEGAVLLKHPLPNLASLKACKYDPLALRQCPSCKSVGTHDALFGHRNDGGVLRHHSWCITCRKKNAQETHARKKAGLAPRRGKRAP